MLRGTYQERTKFLAKKADPADIVWCDCSCYQLPRQCRMYDPENYKDLREAMERYFWHRVMRTLYWSVHVKKRHLLHIHCAELAWNEDTCCRECRRRRYGDNAAQLPVLVAGDD